MTESNFSLEPRKGDFLLREEEAISLRQILAKVQSEKDSLEAEFCKKRAKFKTMYLQMEEELCIEREKHQCGTEEASQREVEMLKQELADMMTAATMSEQANREELSSLRQQYDEQIVTMQGVLEDASEEAHLSTAAHYVGEREKLSNLNERYEEEIQYLRHRLSSHDREGFFTSVTKSLKRVSGSSSLNTSTEAESLENSMRKAQVDTEVLKSVVLPLEQEIMKLKCLLAEAQSKATGSDGDRGPGLLSETDTASHSMEKVDSLMKIIKSEKAARADLEMFVAVLTTQRNVLQDEADKVKQELLEVCRLLEEEKRSHAMLKETWQMANDQFLESQRLIMMDLRRMQDVMSAEQQRQVAELQREDKEREAQEMKVKILAEITARREQPTKQQISSSYTCTDTPSRASSETSGEEQAECGIASGFPQGSVISIDSDAISRHDFSHNGPRMKRAYSSSELQVASLLNSDTDSLSQETCSLGDVEMKAVGISPERLRNLHPASLTVAQAKAITDPTPDTEARNSMMAAAKMRRDQFLPKGKRLVSDREWHLLHQEMRSAREKLTQPCTMCTSHQTELQAVQDEMGASRLEVKQMECMLAVERKNARKAMSCQSLLEKRLKTCAEDLHAQVSVLMAKIQECEKFISQLKQSFSQCQTNLHHRLGQLAVNRDQLDAGIRFLKDENDKLVGKHWKTALELQAEDISMPDNMEDMQVLLLWYREEVIASRVAKEHIEETLHSELNMLRARLLSGHRQKQCMEGTLNQEMTTLQPDIAYMRQPRTDPELERTVSLEAECKLCNAEAVFLGMEAACGGFVIDSPRHVAADNPRHDVSDSPTHDVSDSSMYDISDSPRQDATDNLRHDATDNPRHDATDSPRHGARDSPSHDVSDSPRHDAVDISRHDVSDSPSHDFTDSLSHDFTDSPRDDLCDSPRHDLYDSPRHDVSDSPRQDATESPRHDATGSPRHDVAYSPSQDATDIPRHDVTDSPWHDAADSLRNDAVNISRHDISDSPRHDFSDSPRHCATDSPRHDISDSPRHDFSDSPGHDFSDSPRHDFSDSPRHDISDSPRHDISDRPRHDDAMDSPRHNAADSPMQGVADSPRQNAVDSPRHNSADSPRRGVADSPRTDAVDSPRTDAVDSPRHDVSQTVMNCCQHCGEFFAGDCVTTGAPSDEPQGRPSVMCCSCYSTLMAVET